MNNSPFGFDTPEDSLGFLLWQTTMCWQREIKKALEQHDITHPQFVIMATLAWFKLQKSIISQSCIIQWTKLDKMTVSKSLAKLVDDGIVKREEHPNDPRAKSVMLTKSGETLINKLIPIVENVDHHFFNKLSKQENKRLISLLNHLSSDS